MRHFGLIGYPLTSSFSKKYFTEKFEREQIPACVYENYPLKQIGDFEDLLRNHPGLNGLNVTIPYKKDVIPYLHQSTEAVQEIGACNCINFVDGKLIGHNTDITGFEDSFKQLLQPQHNKALILGTGGAAAAVEYVLKKRGISFLSVTRSQTNKVNTITYNQLSNELVHEYKLVINTTPLGMYPDINTAPPLPYHLLSAEHYLYDLVYNPAETLFLKKGKEQGAIVKNGEDMLLIQAEESWKIWNGDL